MIQDTRITDMCNTNKLFLQDLDYQDRSNIIFDEIKKKHARYNLNNNPIRIYHIGRNNQRLFETKRYVWNGKNWTNPAINTNYNKSMKLFVDGSGGSEFESCFKNYANGNNENTSRNYFHCFCDVIKNAKDRHTGGTPQLVGLYNGTKFNGMYHGTIIDGKAYYQALEVDDIYRMSDVRWYNENFEICDWDTKQRQSGAMIQPISKKATP